METRIGGRSSTSASSVSSSSSSSSTSSSSSSSSAASLLVRRCGRERMVEVELDAARALADFAKIALLEREKIGMGGNEWGNTGRRTRKRIRNSDNTTNNSGSSSTDDEGAVEVKAEEEHSQTKGLGLRPPCSLDLNQHALPEEEHNKQDVGKKFRIENQQKQMYFELTKPTPGCSSSRSSLGAGKGKPELTEAEKEAKRLRRVLANRESARQTIRRRQVLCEDLTRKAAELTLDNEKIKKERELALKEYQRLSDTNRLLKLKMAEKIKEEASTMLELETPASSSTKYPPVMPQRLPFIQYPYPPSAGSLDPLKTCSNHEVTNPSYEEGPLTSPIPTLYAPPYMWFCPIIQQGSSSVNTCASSGTGVDTMVKELGSSTAALLEGRTPSNCRVANSSIDVKMDPELNQPPGRDQELQQVTPEQSTKHTLDAAIAADARKRRKELTKLKRRGRESQMYI